MCEDKYDRITDAQATGDEAFLSDMRARYVEPLVTEICERVPGYADMDGFERFVALAGLNEECSRRGCYLMLDFSATLEEFEKHDLNLGEMITSCAVFSGDAEAFSVIEGWHGVTIYEPRHLAESPHMGETTPFGGGGGVAGNGAVITSIISDKSFPLPFRVALLARHVSQNVLIRRGDACRFAMGAMNNPPTFRWFADGFERDGNQLVGWHVRIRDTSPNQNLCKHLSRVMCGYARSAKEFGEHSCGDYSVAESRPIRAYQSRTDLLIAFVDEYIPSTGRRIGRARKDMGWEDVFREFVEKYPDKNRYSTPNSMRNAYYNAVRLRKERGEGR